MSGNFLLHLVHNKWAAWLWSGSGHRIPMQSSRKAANIRESGGARGDAGLMPPLKQQRLPFNAAQKFHLARNCNICAQIAICAVNSLKNTGIWRYKAEFHILAGKKGMPEYKLVSILKIMTFKYLIRLHRLIIRCNRETVWGKKLIINFFFFMCK